MAVLTSLPKQKAPANSREAVEIAIAQTIIPFGAVTVAAHSRLPCIYKVKKARIIVENTT